MISARMLAEAKVSDNNQEQLNDISETSKRLKISTFTTRRLIKAGHLRAVRIARRVLVPERELQRVITEGCGKQSIRS